ncbi:DUF6794 domain-containing protein [Methylobacter sp.]|uniref:DUF6794 domain-containing protein n=1 Tax=Methylobacter sp. TaxID=2051955 RepID=UPI0035229777
MTAVCRSCGGLPRGESTLQIYALQHFGLGMAIRNAFGLHEQGSKLLASCNNNELYNSVHPDDASGMVILALWQSLQT